MTMGGHATSTHADGAMRRSKQEMMGGGHRNMQMHLTMKSRNPAAQSFGDENSLFLTETSQMQ